MNDSLKKLCVKIVETDGLAACLDKSLKGRSKEICDEYGVKAAASAKKADLAEKAEAAVMEGAKAFLAGEGRAYADSFGEIAVGGARIQDDSDEKIMTLYRRGLVFFAEDGDAAKVIVPADIRDIASGAAHSHTSSKEAISEALEITPEERNTHRSEVQKKEADTDRTVQETEIIRYARSLSNIYGVYPVTQLKQVLDMNYGKALSPNEIMDALEKVGAEDHIYIDNKYVVSDLLPDPEAYNVILGSLQQGDTYYVVNKEEIDEYDEGVILDDGLTYKFFRNYLIRKTGSEEKADEVMMAFFMAAMRDSAPAVLLEISVDHGIKFDDSDDFNSLISLYTNWYYGLHTWFCKGYKPEMLIIDKMQTRNIKLPANVNPMKHVKVGRNDKCPCGSGKKYKACCGRN